jgi:folate-binding protein YgfZ
MKKSFVLETRGVIKIIGPDKEKLLQGIISNNISKISHDSLLYALMLTPQGKFWCDMFIVAKGEEWWLDIPASLITEFCAKLMKYKLRLDVTIEDLSNQYRVVIDYQYSSNELFPDPRDARLGWRGIVSKEDALIPQPGNLLQEMRTEASHSDYDERRMEYGIPEAIIDMVPGKAFPLEYGLEKLNAIDFNKGCYVGQEVIARTHNRGEVRKRLGWLEANPEAVLTPGTDLLMFEKKVGEVLGLHCCEPSIAMAIVRIPDLEQKLGPYLFEEVITGRRNKIDVVTEDGIEAVLRLSGIEKKKSNGTE